MSISSQGSHISSAGQVLGSSTAIAAGSLLLPRTGQPVVLVLAFISIVAGVVILGSFVLTRILRRSSK